MENSNFAESGISEIAIYGPKDVKIITKHIIKYGQQILLKFHAMTNLFECFGKLTF